jgi:dTMP kinase
MMKGIFITFEGIDGTGKTTQQHLVAQVLRDRGYDVVESREPGGTQLAESVRKLVLDASLPLTTDTQTLLYLAARSEHVNKLLRPSLAAGKIVICDRFSDSTLVYQGLAQGKSITELDTLRQLNAFATGGLVPDLTLVFDASPEALLARRVQRGVSDRYEQQGLEFQQHLRAGFLQLAKHEPQRIKLIDAGGNVEEVSRAVLIAIDSVLDEEQ